MAPTVRIAHVTEPLTRGGAEGLVTDLVRALARLGLECSVFTLGPPGDLAPTIEKAGIPVVEVPLRRFYDPRRTVQMLTTGSLRREVISLTHRVRTLARCLADFGPAIVHTHLLVPDVAGALASAKIGARCISTQHDMFRPGHFISPAEQYLWDRKVGLAAQLDAVVAVSRAVLDFVHNELGVDRDRIELIHNGIELERFHNTVLPTSVRIFGVLGALNSWKGHDVAVKAFAGLARDHPELELRIAGSGPTRAQLDSQVREYGIHAQVSFLGEVTEPETFLAEVDVLLVPSFTEGFPLVAIEAMAAGRPVLASAAGGLTELVEPGVTGLLVPPGQPEALQDAMRILLDNPALAATMGVKGRKAADRFGISAVAASHAGMYARVLAPSTGHL